MQESTENLIRAILNQNQQLIYFRVKALLEEDKTQKSKRFVENSLKTLEKLQQNQLTELPYNLKGKIKQETPDTFPADRYIVTDEIAKITDEIINIHNVQQELKELNINYFPTLLLYGKSGCGKTMLARYIALKTNLPYYYMNFSQLIDSHMGNTANNISMVFDFIKKNPGVLCIDEIDTIGQTRTANATDSQGEINRITITLMQEIEKELSDSIVIATTNFDKKVDTALKRRFSKIYEVQPFNFKEATKFVYNFFQSAQIIVMNQESQNWGEEMCKNWLLNKLKEKYGPKKYELLFTDFISTQEEKFITPSYLTKICTEKLINILIAKKGKNNEKQIQKFPQ